ncbi:MerR family transcriptional regulator [Thermopolyspora sp. NPDC052614]|uniref:helix-turn-helix domain-containing protein n=1 Tax=Thermopolyspora sp. NPDC052614 TaxID=3155682 RepID=UPI00342A3DD3
MSETWTIGELAERAAEALRASADTGEGLGAPSLNGRVRDVPNERLIRWYTTIGLLDPPLARRGRVALYGMRHLAQLVAIKRRQAAGRSIAEIQVELAGATDATLAAIAGLSFSPGFPDGTSPSASISSGAPAADAPVRSVPPAAPPAVPPATPPTAPLVVPSPGRAAVRPPERAPSPRAARRDTPDRFWARDAAAGRTSAPEAGSRQVRSLEAPPSESVPKPAVTVRPPAAYHDEPAERNAAPPLPELIQGIRLSPSATLLLGPTLRPLGGDDLAAIAATARPLLDALYERGLIDDASREIR